MASDENDSSDAQFIGMFKGDLSRTLAVKKGPARVEAVYLPRGAMRVGKFQSPKMVGVTNDDMVTYYQVQVVSDNLGKRDTQNAGAPELFHIHNYLGYSREIS